MKAWHIDSSAREVRAVEYADTADLRKLVGGYIEAAYQWSNGDVLYVDEEGLLKRPEHFFRITLRSDQPFAGNGVVVGKECIDANGTYHGNADPVIGFGGLRTLLSFGTVLA